jgi:hypothetical protein
MDILRKRILEITGVSKKAAGSIEENLSAEAIETVAQAESGAVEVPTKGRGRKRTH